MNEVQALKCKKCGAPAYADQKLEGFLCPYCRDFTPWVQTRSHFAPEVNFRHRPIPIVDGLLKLTHVGMPEVEVGDPRDPDEMALRTSNADTGLLSLDAAAYKAWTERGKVTAKCESCDADVSGYTTQNIIECPYCGNKIIGADTLRDGEYRQNAFGYDKNIFDRAIPFTISADEAKRQILRIAADNPREFANQDIHKRLETDLQALYLPYRLEDVSVKATFDTEKGKITIYHDRINWALPQCTVFDIYLMNALHPWDFGSVEPFTPAFMEGDVKVFVSQNNEEKTSALRRMLWRETPEMVRSAFGVKTAKLLTWDYNFRRHQYALINLPIWFLDKRSNDGANDLQIRAAVNGQTGKAAALILQNAKQSAFFSKSEPKDYIRIRESANTVKMSDECTMYSPPIKITTSNHPFFSEPIDILRI